MITHKKKKTHMQCLAWQIRICSNTCCVCRFNYLVQHVSHRSTPHHFRRNPPLGCFDLHFPGVNSVNSTPINQNVGQVYLIPCGTLPLSIILMMSSWCPQEYPHDVPSGKSMGSAPRALLVDSSKCDWADSFCPGALREEPTWTH